MKFIDEAKIKVIAGDGGKTNYFSFGITVSLARSRNHEPTLKLTTGFAL